MHLSPESRTATDGLHSSSPRSSRPLPVTRGRLMDFAEDPAAVMLQLYRTHGEIAALEEDGRRVVLACGPRYNHQVLSDTDTFHSRFSPIRGPKNSAQRRLTASLLNMNGEEHKQHRRFVASAFQRSSITNYHAGIIEHVQDMLNQWTPGQTLDIAREMNQYMLRVTSSMLFGFDQQELAYEIGRLTDRWMATNHEVGMSAYIADSKSSSSYERLLQQAEELEPLIRKMIDLRRSSAPANDVLSLLLRAREADGTGLTDEALLGQAAVLFAAAHMTTAHSLTWALFLLSQHPAVAAEVVRELQTALHGAPPTVEQLEKLPLLDRAIKESMRVLPASAYSMRMCAKPVQLGPFSLPPAAVVIFSPLVSHRLPQYFAEPTRYLPNRWETLAPAPYVYIPFGSGPRMCLGSAMAMMTIKTTLATMLQRFRVSVVPGATINGRVVATMLAATSGMPAVLSSVTGSYTAAPVTGNIHDLIDLPGDAGKSRTYHRAA